MQTKRARVLVDVAGATMGGAGRWLSELDQHLGLDGGSVRVTGRGFALSPRSLLAREISVVRDRPQRVVATNNVAFLAPAVRQRVVLVRNALHFLSEREALEFRDITERPWEGQARVIRSLLRRASLIVVPSTSMADRVRFHVPDVAERVVVRFHPVSSELSGRGLPSRGSPFRFLCPVLDAPFKRLDLALRPVLGALDLLVSRGETAPFCLDLTMSPRDARELAAHRPWVRLLGRLSVRELSAHRQAADAVIYPTSIESFGYPLAEARAEGRWVLAPATAHNSEIAGAALVPYADDPGELSITISDLLAGRVARPKPDPSPFSPEYYFRWLLSDGRFT